MTLTSEWWVYVLQSQRPRFSKAGKKLPGVYYVGSSTNVSRRLRQHNGEIKGGGAYTSAHRPWLPAALYGPYGGRGEALKAEMKLKRTKRSKNRTQWTTRDSPMCCGLGALDPWVLSADHPTIMAAAKPAEPKKRYRRKRTN